MPPRWRCSRAPARRVLARESRRPGRGSDRKLSPDPPNVSLIVAAHDEQAVIAAKVANALALDYPRELLELIVACDGCSDATAERARGAGADVVLELPRGGKIRAQDAAVERRAARSSPSRTPTRCGSRRAARRSWARSPIRASATPAGRCASCRTPTARGRLQPGGRLLALRAGPARARVAPLLDHRGQRRDLRDAPRRLHRGRPDHGPRPVAALQDGQAGPARRLRAERASQREDGPLADRRVRAQAAHDEPHLADRPARRDALAARLPARLRADDPLPPAAALLHARSCTRSRWPPTSRSWRWAPERCTS